VPIGISIELSIQILLRPATISGILRSCLPASEILQGKAAAVRDFAQAVIADRGVTYGVSAAPDEITSRSSRSKR
jgi:hypothetical protein